MAAAEGCSRSKQVWQASSWLVPASEEMHPGLFWKARSMRHEIERERTSNSLNLRCYIFSASHLEACIPSYSKADPNRTSNSCTNTCQAHTKRKPQQQQRQQPQAHIHPHRAFNLFVVVQCCETNSSRRGHIALRVYTFDVTGMGAEWVVDMLDMLSFAHGSE